MTEPLKYKNHIEHYRLDAEYVDYFQNDKFEIESIRRRYQCINALAESASGKKVLEIGSGGGEGYRQLKLTEFAFFPLDLSHKNLQQIAGFGNNIFPVTADGFCLPLKPQSFDLVIMSEVLEHLSEPGKALEEITRVLKPGKKLLISVPYKERLSYQLCIHCNQLTPTHAHFHSFDEKTITKLLRENGFKIQSILKMNNKAANRLRFNIITRKFPYFIWRLFDRVFNLILPKPSHMVVSVIKELH